ncbi:hypothetical protein FGG79_18375 [Bacillus sp. BHET2]|uniref:hypothetical protein n=1 Tax=Bacillus sp. BHET2 TaxID=2583818 RepID=UPI00110D6C6E|nr:hypothetical protein [Bacillus sp. BHET2]TMU84101.1 hypothetical protein FGG79_18375 [Bacillus sp. BHET2]
MKQLHTIRKGNGSLIAICTFLLLSSIYLISTTLSSLPGTYAWFTSETSASGTIHNATTEDLLQIQASDVQYGNNCTMQNSLSVKNISDMSTTVTVSFLTSNGNEELASQKLKPGESMNTNPEDMTKWTGECDETSLTYRVQGFIHYVDENHTVAVDQTELKNTMMPDEEKSIDEQVDKEDKQSVEEADKEVPDNGEVDDQQTGEEEKPSTVEEEEKVEEAEPPPAEEAEQKDETTDQPQIEEETSSPDQPDVNENEAEESSDQDQAVNIMETEEKQEVTQSVPSE